ncbi:Zinc transporter ZupT [bioreactor metagenome]|uniref:Zinc transporter ZupT n=1 Tax=bioreactor metagenome TaxID=1076179 RepID=A0A645CXA4_9ZZZZ
MFTNIELIAIVGLLTGLIGMGFGMFFSSLALNIGYRFKKLLLGLIGGVMLSVVSFDLIPEAIEESSIYFTVIGLFLGLIVSNILDKALEKKITITLEDGNEKSFKAAVMMAIGIGIHNIPGGIALGSLFHISYREGISLALVLIFHGIPEAIAVGIYLKESHSHLKNYLWILLLTSLTMGIGALLGAIAGNVSSFIISISLSFAGSMILYILFRETIPEAIELMENRYSTSSIITGVILGILIISMLH